MKNQPLLFALAFVGICALSACTNTMEGVKKDAKDVNNWAHYRPSGLSEDIGQAPTGYLEKRAIPAAAPDAASDENSSAPDESQNPQSMNGNGGSPYVSGGLVWHQISNYNAGNPSLSNVQGSSSVATPVVVKYSHSVDVYPVNSDVSPYTQLDNVNATPVSGQMIQQVFFPYGSANISGIERQNLREMAQSLVQNGSEYRLNVVGHASKRVNHVRSPVKRKMINLKMAQKRANAVANELLKSGATPDWIVATSLGEQQPNPHRNGKSQEAADRRAEVYLNNN